MWHVHIMEHYSATKKELLIRTKTWVNLTDGWLTGKTWVQWSTHCVVSFM